MSIKNLLVCLIVVCLAGFAAADEPGPAPAADTPEALVRRFAEAISTLDRRKLRDCYHATDGAATALADAEVTTLIQSARIDAFYRGTIRKFGDASFADAMGELALLFPHYGVLLAPYLNVAAMTVKVDGDRATVTLPEVEGPAALKRDPELERPATMTLRRVDGRWGVIPTPRPAPPADEAAEIAAQQALMARTTADASRFAEQHMATLEKSKAAAEFVAAVRPDADRLSESLEKLWSSGP